MCANAELARMLERIEKTTSEAKKELVETRLDVRAIKSRMDTWEKTKCETNTTDIHDLQEKVEKVRDVATSAAFKAAAMYSLGMLAVGGVITWAIKATLGA